MNIMKYDIAKYSALICGFFLTSSAFAAGGNLTDLSDRQRIERIERLVSSDVMREQTQTIQALREEVSALREQIEQQRYDLDSMKQRQRNLYLDMDRRINSVETGGSNRLTQTAPVPPPNTAEENNAVTADVAPGSDKDGQEAYSKAFALLKEGQYKHSITAFEVFRTSYPGSKYADNAQYWLGEASYVSRDYKRALTEFQQLIAQYPDSTKNSGARLKIGYVYFELKNWSAARDALQQVVTLYPDTSVAKKASERLQRMKREGN